MIIGLGLDLVEIEGVEQAAERHEGRFVDKYFTEAETGYAASHRRPMEHLAARFAAKEATAKAFGTGFAEGVALRDIEVVLEESGQPRLVLRGKAAKRAEAMGVTSIHLSLAHTETHAAAVVVLEGENPGGKWQGG